MEAMENLKTAIPSGAWDEKLMELYEDESLLSYQKERYMALLDKFQEAYGNREVAIISAPGRSEVCGNHTDHQHGQVVGVMDIDAPIPDRFSEDDQRGLEAFARTLEKWIQFD